MQWQRHLFLISNSMDAEHAVKVAKPVIWMDWLMHTSSMTTLRTWAKMSSSSDYVPLDISSDRYQPWRSLTRDQRKARHAARKAAGGDPSRFQAKLIADRQKMVTALWATQAAGTAQG